MKSRYFKKFLSSLIFSFVGLSTLLFFAPSEVYLGNSGDFSINIDLAILILSLCAIAASLIFSSLVSFLPIKLLKILNLSILSITLCYYIQSLFLNGSLIILTGEELTLSKSTLVVNILIWTLIIFVVFFAWYLFKKKHHEKIFITATKYISVALVIMQLVGFFSLYFNYDKSVNLSKSAYISSEGQLEVSKNKNVIYFVIDYADGTIVQNALKDKPDLFDGFNGFTYYPNNSFVHNRSFPAITYLLTNKKCYYDIPYTQYIDNSFTNNEFLNNIQSLKTDIRAFTNNVYLGSKANSYIKNIKSLDSFEISRVNISQFIKNSLKVSGFKGMPYILKQFFNYNTDEINVSSTIAPTDYAPVNDDLGFYNMILTEKVSVNELYSSAFRFYHMFGSHPGAVINENAEYQKDVSLSQALRGDFKIIKAYLEQLREVGAYDNSTIIITADHGHFAGHFSGPQTCLMMVKPAGADSASPMQTLQTPVWHEDLFATVLKGLGGDYSSFGKPIDEIPENAKRTRYHYNTFIDLDSGHETFMKEYIIEGDARDINSYKESGKEWPVKSTL